MSLLVSNFKIVNVDDLNLSKLIGVGGFGWVYLCNIDNKEYAVKVYKKAYVVACQVEDLVN